MKKQMVNFGIYLLLAMITSCTSYRDKNAPVEKRIDDLLPEMTLEEKVMLLGGDTTGFNGCGVERLGIPLILMSDGPVGVRNGKATAYPVSVNMASTWDTALIAEYGKALGEETRAKGKTCILGPCVGIHRFPQGGRNFESFGEDPWLTSRMAVSVVRGVQSLDVIATVKHFACNDQEWQRTNYDVIVDDRALHEIHLAAFEAAVKEGNVRAVMSSYNKINGPHASENKPLLTDILKGEWGFTGIVMSDWVSVYSAVEAANNGLDLEMPYPVWMKDSLLAAIRAGKVSEEVINDKVRRHLRVRFEMGWFDNPLPVADQNAVETQAHRDLARKMAEESMILVKNEGLLPLSMDEISTLAMIGPSVKKARTGGGGSSTVEPWIAVSPWDGMTALVGNKVKITYAEGVSIDPLLPDPLPGKYLVTPDGKSQGLMGEYFDNKAWEGKPVLIRTDSAVSFDFGGDSPDPSVPKDNFSVRWTGKLIAPFTGKLTLMISSDDGSFLYLNGKLVADNGGDHGEQVVSCEIVVRKGQQYDLRLDFTESGGRALIRLGWRDPWKKSGDPSIAEAVKVASRAGAAIVCVGRTADFEHEGDDVNGFLLPAGQDELVKAVAEANPNTVVVLYGGTPAYLMNWIGKVKAVILAGYPGQEGGDALARILTGAVSPSGKLPYSYIQRCEESPACKGYKAPGLQVPYSEGVFVGYRWYDKQGIDPLFPFGFGLSYTTFDYSNLKIEKREDGKVTVSVDVRNSGKTMGKEVVEVYVSQINCQVDRPVKELKAFSKTEIAPGEVKTVSMILGQHAFSYWHPEKKKWVSDGGDFGIMVGASSRDIRLKGKVRMDFR